MVTRKEATAGIFKNYSHVFKALKPTTICSGLVWAIGPNFVHYNKVRMFQRFFVACNFLHAIRMQHGCDESLILFSPRCHPI